MTQKSLVRTIATGSVSLILCVFLVTQIAAYYYASKIVHTTHERELNQQLTLLSRTLENPLWSLDEHSIRLIGDSYMAGTESASLIITASHLPDAVYSQSKPSSEDAMYGERIISHEGEVIGTVQVGLSWDVHKEELLRLMLYSVSLASVIILSLVIVVRYLVNKNLAMPLTSLVNWTDRMASGDYGSAPPSIGLSELSSLVSRFHNMSEKIKKREDELVQFRDNLQSLVDDQTQQLKDTQAELLQRERLATLGQLTATVSHELRNPLGTIKTSLFSISNSLEQPERANLKRSIDLADKSIDRCVTIIEELNTYARVRKLYCSETYVDDWLVGVLEEMRLPETIDLKLDINSGVRALFDQEKLRQVIVNLVSNAMDAIAEEGSHGNQIVIGTRKVDDFYQISVKDSGCGIPDDVKSKMFEPLFSTKGFGVGLGMVIVKNIVESHHGQIHVESDLESGSKITVRLPLLFACE